LRGALPESLLESELFGHEKGAFTGATSLRRGMFELADGGTLLLDEIAEMPLPTQTRLLRILESRRFMRVGGDREIEVSVRVITATNRDLRDRVERGQFRRDLYYRLNVLHIDLPPLRARREDIPVLVRRFISEFSRTHDREFRGLAPEAMDILLGYGWPGNVRELRNLIESMVVLAPGSLVRAEDIPAEIRSGRGTSLLPVTPDPTTALVEAASAAAPQTQQLEFIFRTLVELKVDVEDLKHEFERYKRQHPDLLGAAPAPTWPGTEIEVPEVSSRIVDAEPSGDLFPPGEVVDAVDELSEEPEIAFQPGMTMADLEREAIVATLREVGGNRRKAAEKLQRHRAVASASVAGAWWGRGCPFLGDAGDPRRIFSSGSPPGLRFSRISRHPARINGRSKGAPPGPSGIVTAAGVTVRGRAFSWHGSAASNRRPDLLPM
jgi:DNA-binding NtrC family response regulator